MSHLRFALYATIVVLLFLSSAHGEGLTVSVTEGSGANSITSTSTFGAAANNAVEQAITLAPKADTAKNYLYAEGDYSTSRSVSGALGGYCNSGFSVTGPYAKSYYDFWADGSSYASLSEWLQASGANSISAYGSAYSNYGYAADHLSVTSDWGQAQASYFNSAYATPSYAYDYAVVGSASGNSASAISYAYNYDWKDYAYTTFSASSAYNTAMIWNVPQFSSSEYTYANAGTDGGNSWALEGSTKQTSYASDYYGDYSISDLTSPNGFTWFTSSNQPNYAYSSGSNRNTWSSGSAYLYGYPTTAYTANYNSYTGLLNWDWDSYYNSNSLSQYAYNSYGSAGAANYYY